MNYLSEHIWMQSLGWTLLHSLWQASLIALIWAKPPEKKESRSFRGQVIAVLLMLSLITCFWFPYNWYLPIVGIISLLVFYSFGKSFWGMLLVSQPIPYIAEEKQDKIKV